MKKLIACAFVLTFATAVSAMPITGDLGIAGDVIYDDTTRILAFSNEHIIGADGDFSHLAPVVMGSLTAFYQVDIGDIDAATNPVSADPWTLVDFVFTPATVSMSSNGSFFDFILRGIMSAQNFEDTEYVFALSTNPGKLIGTFSAATVPEPESFALFAIGLLGVLALRRRSFAASRTPR